MLLERMLAGSWALPQLHGQLHGQPALAAAAPMRLTQLMLRCLSNGTASTSGTDAPPGGGLRDEAGSRLSPQPQLVEQIMSEQVMNKSERLQRTKADTIRSFQRFEGDVGSSEVQVALLTEKIRSMGEHFRQHRKDKHSMRGLQAILNERRSLLGYLRRKDFDRYCMVLHRLGLKDTYAKQAQYDKYRVGTRLGTPTEPLKRYGFR